jgi:hypothetical protein
MGLGEFEEPFARMMIGSIITQLRSYSIGCRVDDWIWKSLPGLREQQEVEIRSQLAENERALKPETRQKFPKPLVDANTSMNALYVTLWGERLHDPGLAFRSWPWVTGARPPNCVPSMMNFPTSRPTTGP